MYLYDVLEYFLLIKLKVLLDIHPFNCSFNYNFQKSNLVVL